MFDIGGWGAAELPSVDDCIAGFLDVISLNRVDENLARAGTVLAYCDVLDMRLEAAEAAGGDPGETVRGALCDLAVTMTGTRRDAAVMHDVAERLHRMPLTALRFVTGSFDWSTTVAITSVLHRASDETIATIEYEVCAAGGRMRPQALRNRIWRLWMKADPDGAAEAREVAKSEEIGVRIDRAGPGGISSLIAKITDLEAAEADALIVEIVGTVCKDDPRSTGMLRAAGLMALLHGEHSLACQCDLGDECPFAGAADDLPPRRGHLLQIVVAVETLLGLSAEPAILADGTPIDPEVARIVATDAKWQAMLTELVDMLKPQQDTPDKDTGDGDENGPDSDDGGPDDGGPDGGDGPDDGGPDPTDGSEADGDREDGRCNDSGGGKCLGGGEDSGGGKNPRSGHDPGLRLSTGSLLRRVVGIGRVRGAGELPSIRVGGDCSRSPAVPMLGEESARDQLVARWLAWIADDPERARGIFADGHGGEVGPSPAAVTYRPSARVAAFVRAAYRTCTFPRCDVPSARCQIDHVVPFDKDDPRRGGWTIVTNLQPVCVFHHQAKTAKTWSAAMLAGGAILWSNSVGFRSVTLPEFSLGSHPGHRRRRRRSAEMVASLSEPTRWELDYSGSAPPTLADFRSASTDSEKKRLAEKRRAYLEHCRVVHARIRQDWSRYDPAPF